MADYSCSGSWKCLPCIATVLICSILWSLGRNNSSRLLYPQRIGWTCCRIAGKLTLRIASSKDSHKNVLRSAKSFSRRRQFFVVRKIRFAFFCHKKNGTVNGIRFVSKLRTLSNNWSLSHVFNAIAGTKTMF